MPEALIETIENKPESKRGGARPGSGRKPLLDKAEIDRVRALISQHGIEVDPGDIKKRTRILRLLDVLYEKGVSKEDPRISVFTWASTDNPNFPKDHFDAERKRLSPEEFARRYEGQFAKMEGLVYDLPADQIIAPRTLNVRDVILGLDFGFHNPAAAAVLKIDADGVYYITDEYHKAGKVQDEIESDLRALQAVAPFRDVYPDPAEPDRVENMKRHGFYVKTVDKNVVLGIDRVRELIRKRQLFVFNTCKNTIDEFNSYRYDPEKPKEEPIKENDHLMDAIRYAVYNHNAKSFKVPAPTVGLVKPYPGMAA